VIIVGLVVSVGLLAAAAVLAGLVLLVAFNHAGVTFLSGGYIGVDVFFVLSTSPLLPRRPRRRSRRPFRCLLGKPAARQTGRSYRSVRPLSSPAQPGSRATQRSRQHSRFTPPVLTITQKDSYGAPGNCGLATALQVQVGECNLGQGGAKRPS